MRSPYTGEQVLYMDRKVVQDYKKVGNLSMFTSLILVENSEFLTCLQFIQHKIFDNTTDRLFNGFAQSVLFQLGFVRSSVVNVRFGLVDQHRNKDLFIDAVTELRLVWT